MQRRIRSGSRFQTILGVAVLALLTPGWAQTLDEEIRQALERLPHPKNAAEFQAAPHQAGRDQGNSSICWSHATCSFVESEMARLKLPAVQLSVIYPFYCQTLEKARLFVRTKGASRFSPGDLFTGLPEVCQKYGALPATAYDRQTAACPPDHTRLYAELDDVMHQVRTKGQWNEKRVLARVRKVLDRHLGTPPVSFEFNGRKYTPASFATEVVRLPWDDYRLFTSFQTGPFHTWTEFRVPDNWAHHTNYYNLPLDEFYATFKRALSNGFSVAVSVDTSEPCYHLTGRYAFIPPMDIPSAGITQAVREWRFRDGATSDDHAIHVLGLGSFGGEDWFLAKDSWKTTWHGEDRGCLFLHQSYIKLKILAFIVHRDALAQDPLRPAGSAQP